MASLNAGSTSFESGNVSGTERWLSVAAGVAFTLAAARRGSLLRSLLFSAAGASLLSRGATGYCAMKAAVQDRTPLREGLQQQWSRTRDGIAQVTQARWPSSDWGAQIGQWSRRALGGMSGTATTIDNMHVLYVIELQELHSAEQQMADLLQSIAPLVGHGQLAARFSEHERELRARTGEIQGILSAVGAPTRAHPDQGMRALINESRKVSHIAAGNVRDAALVASVQRLIHYKIAGYGTIASYAETLGRTEEAGRFKNFADADKRLDADLSDLAKSSLNQDASRSPERSTQEMRTH